MSMTDFLELLDELGLHKPDGMQAARFLVRLIVACLLGGIIGLEREAKGRAAGLRTHMLVALGSMLFTLVPAEAGSSPNDLAQIVKGIAAGVGFLGAGAILKREDEREVEGITTAAGIWLTAAVGFAVGAGWIGLAILSTLFAWMILFFLSKVEKPGKPTK